jgi:hypothetical protein
MNSHDIDATIDELVTEHRPRAVLPRPGWRSANCCVLAFLGAGIMFALIQPFRVGFGKDLLAHPLFLLEELSGVALVWCGMAWAFRRAVPGARAAKWAGAALVAACFFVVAVSLSLSGLGAHTTDHGARHACWLEVLACGGLTLTALAVALRRGYPRFGWVQSGLLGLLATLPGAVLMQLACMYSPLHGLVFHYLPMLGLVLAGLAMQRFLRR